MITALKKKLEVWNSGSSNLLEHIMKSMVPLRMGELMLRSNDILPKRRTWVKHKSL